MMALYNYNTSVRLNTEHVIKTAENQFVLPLPQKACLPKDLQV